MKQFSFRFLILTVTGSLLLSATAVYPQVQFPEIPVAKDEEDTEAGKKTEEKGKAEPKAEKQQVSEKGTPEAPKEPEKKTSTKDNQLSEAAIDRTGV
ncbi:MAG TPA: hypothetical protein PKY99_08735, partial [Turneriella sp.]|nr:hypothetical protein [Turneriella sp.]